MDTALIKEIVTVIVAILAAWGVMRERMLKSELRVDSLEKDLTKLSEKHEEHKEKVYKILKEISEQQQKILLILERNNVR